jgi:hypothetical protein
MQPYDRREDLPPEFERCGPPAREQLLESLRQENASLRQLVVQLSELVIKKISERH